MKCPKCGFKMSYNKCVHCGYSDDNLVNEKKSRSFNYYSVCKSLIIVGMLLMVFGIFSHVFGSRINFNSKNAVGLFKDQLSPIEMEPTVIYDDNGIIVKINSISSESYDFIINYSIKNKSDSRINFSIAEPYINDIYVPFVLHDELAAGDAHDGSFALSKEILSDNGIFDIMSISFPIEITTPAGDIIDKSAYKKVKTNKYDSNIQSYNLGKVVYEDDLVQLQFLELKDKPTADNPKNKQLRLFVHNKTNGSIKMGIKSKKIFVNDKKLNIDFNNVIPANKYGINEYNFNYDNLSDIHSIKINCSYYDINSHNLINDSDYFEIKIK